MLVLGSFSLHLQPTKVPVSVRHSYQAWHSIHELCHLVRQPRGRFFPIKGVITCDPYKEAFRCYMSIWEISKTQICAGIWIDVCGNMFILLLHYWLLIYNVHNKKENIKPRKTYKYMFKKLHFQSMNQQKNTIYTNFSSTTTDLCPQVLVVLGMLWSSFTAWWVAF